MRSNPLLAYVLPFALFLVLGSAETMEALRPYYPWVYAAKIAVVFGSWCWFRREYPAPSVQGLPLGVVVGVVGVVVWVGLTMLHLESHLAAVLPSVFGGERVAYNPYVAIESPLGRAAFLGVRFFGLAVVVPLIEEVFWRGFLMRWLIDEKFTDVPFGQYTPMSFAVVTFLFAAVHPAELLAAIVWGAMVNLLAIQTKNLWACVVAHAVTNLLLGFYILKTGEWILW